MFFCGSFEEMVKDEPVHEVRTRLGVLVLVACSRMESIVKQSPPAEPFTSIGSGVV